MSIRQIMFYTCILLGTVMPSLSYADDIIITTPPPPVRTETIPSPRTGHIWSPGYWKWENSEHVWVEGHWIEIRPNAKWIPDRWEQEDSTHWHFLPGHWESE